jgi:hypothetical protein
LTLRSSLLEQNRDCGVFVSGSDATIEATAVRGTVPESDGALGTGVWVQAGKATGRRSALALRASLLERNHFAGVGVDGSDATIESIIVRDTQPLENKASGMGILVQVKKERSNLTLRSSLLERNHLSSVTVVGSDATIEAAVIRETLPHTDGRGGRGLEVEDNADTRQRSTVTLRSSLLEKNQDVGVLVSGSDATIEATVVRDTLLDSTRTSGRAISVQDSDLTQEQSTLTLRSSVLERNHEVGVFVLASSATVESTIVRNTLPNLADTGGDGIVVGPPSTVAITSTHVESNARAGITNFSSAVVLASSLVLCNRIDLDGEDTVEGSPFTFDGSRSNLCGCDAPDSSCPVLSASLSPPSGIPPTRSEP